MSPCRAEARAEDARSALTRGPSRSYPWWSPSIRPQPTHTCFRRAGYIDYLDEADTLFAESNAITGRLTDAIERIGSKMHERGEEMNAAAAEPGPLTRQRSRALIGHAADDMNAFAEEAGQDLPKLRTNLLGALTAVKEATRLLRKGRQERRHSGSHSTTLIVLTAALVARLMGRRGSWRL